MYGYDFLVFVWISYGWVMLVLYSLLIDRSTVNEMPSFGKVTVRVIGSRDVEICASLPLV